MKCDSCGLESEFEEAFLKGRRFGLGRAHYCPPCASKRDVRAVLFLLGFGILTSVVLKVAHPSLPLTWASVFRPLIVLLVLPILIVIHELAHALVARLLGMRVYSISIGLGKTLAEGRFLGMHWQWHALPLAGGTSVAGPPGRLDRLKLWLTYLAGPGVHAVLVLAAMGLQQLLIVGESGSGLLLEASGLVYETNLVLLLFNLLPIQSPSSLGPIGSDGWNLLKLPFANPDEIELRRSSYYVMEALEAIRRRDPTSARQWIDQAQRRFPASLPASTGLGYVLAKLGDFDAARQIFAAALAAGSALKPARRYVLLNNIAYSHAILRDAERLDEADRFSTEAYQNAPWMSPFVGTRGTVLVALGRVEEGIALLRRAMETADDAGGKAENACQLAIAEVLHGDLISAQHYLELAKRWNPEGALIAAATRQLDQATRSVPVRGRSQPGQGEDRAARPATLRERVLRFIPREAPLTRQSMADWGWLIAAWGFWNLMLLRWFSISPGMAFMALGVVAMFSGSPGILLGLAVVAAWTGLTMLPWGTGPEIIFGLANLALAAILILRYRRQGTRGTLQQATPPTNSPPSASGPPGRRLALGAGLAGLVSLAWLVALTVSVASIVREGPSAGPLTLFDQMWAWGQAHPRLFYLIEIAAILAVALGIGATSPGARSKALPATGIIPGGCVLLLILLAIVIG